MILIENKKAFFDYQILEKFEAGIELKGFEVKALRTKKASLNGAYVKIYNNEAWLIGASISPFQEKNVPATYDKERPRKLLLKKKEIKYLLGKSQEKGLTIVPLKLYNNKNLLKIEIGLAKSKKQFDKREIIKKRETEREIQRKLKRISNAL